MADGPDLHRIVGHAIAVGRRSDPDGPSSGTPGERHVFHVLATVGAIVSLRPEDTDARTFCKSLIEGERLVLTHALPDGALQAEILVDRWSPAGRVLTAVCPSPLGPIQRREAYRVPVVHPLVLVCARDGAVQLVEATTIDVSTSGVAFTTKVPLRADEVLAAFIVTPGGSVPVVLQVVDRGDGPRAKARARIVELVPTDRAALTAHLRRTEVARVGTAPRDLRSP